MNSQKNKPKVISTFSGCGGSSLGYHLAGFDVLMAVEMEKHAVDVYKKNFPETYVFHGDIHNLTVDKVFELTNIKPRELDLFDGSPPCQGFSMAGKREFCDPRNQLYNEYIRLLKGLQPKTFVMENVKGLVTGKNKLIFKDILKQLKSCGYDVKVKLMNAMYYNCATSRARVIFIGVRKDLNVPASHPKPQSKPITVRECLNGFVSKYPITYPINDFVCSVIDRVKPGESFSKYHKRGSYFNYRKIDLDKPCPTITKTEYKHFFINNRIMQPDEAALLQSFSKDFIWVGNPREIWERIGNSVPPNLMKAIALHIKNNILSKVQE